MNKKTYGKGAFETIKFIAAQLAKSYWDGAHDTHGVKAMTWDAYQNLSLKNWMETARGIALFIPSMCNTTRIRIIDEHGAELHLAIDTRFIPRVGERIRMSGPKAKVLYAPKVVEVFHDFDADEIIIRLEGAGSVIERNKKKK